MVGFPQAQRKAQEDIDEVIGHSRLPDFCDLEYMPYMRALVKETLRWHPVDPLGEH